MLFQAATTETRINKEGTKTFAVLVDIRPCDKTIIQTEAGVGCSLTLQVEIQPGRIGPAERVIPNVAVSVQCLRVFQVATERVRAQESARVLGVVSSAEVVIGRLLVMDLAGEMMPVQRHSAAAAELIPEGQIDAGPCNGAVCVGHHTLAPQPVVEGKLCTRVGVGCQQMPICVDVTAQEIARPVQFADVLPGLAQHITLRQRKAIGGWVAAYGTDRALRMAGPTRHYHLQRQSSQARRTVPRSALVRFRSSFVFHFVGFHGDRGLSQPK
jgi:hypothetical protein